MKSGYLIYDRPLLQALGTLSALGPWLEGLLLLLLTPRTTWGLLLLTPRTTWGLLLLLMTSALHVPGQVDGVCRYPL